MPGFLLHQGATVICSHGGQAQPAAANPRVKVNGQPVVTQNIPHMISGCGLPSPTAANGPCVIAQWTTGATRVKVGGVPVLLQDSQAVCTPTGASLTAVVVQPRVKGM